MKNTSLLALTLQAPWLSVIVTPEAFTIPKRVENRTWKPGKALVPGQWFALHQGQKYDSAGAQWIRETFDTTVPSADGCTRGAILAVARLWEVTDHALFGRDAVGRKVRDPWFVGPFGWYFTSLHVLPVPVPCSGAQGLWTVDDVTLDALRAQMRTLRTSSSRVVREPSGEIDAPTRAASLGG